MSSQPHIKKFRTPPFNSYIEKEFPKIDYCDSFSLRISNEIEMSNDEIFNLTFEYLTLGFLSFGLSIYGIVALVSNNKKKRMKKILTQPNYTVPDIDIEKRPFYWEL